jgi:hypothetical protein
MLSDVPSEIRLNLPEASKFETFRFSSFRNCINSGRKLKTTFDNFFLKWNDATKFPGMFESGTWWLT